MEQQRTPPDSGKSGKRRTLKDGKQQNTVYLTPDEELDAAKAMIKYWERTRKKITFTEAANKLFAAWGAANAPDFDAIASIGTFEPRAEYVTSHPIPLYGNVSAGPGALASNTAEDYLPCPPWIADADDRLFALRVDGDSMEPTLYAGDIVIVRQGTDASTGEMVVAEIDDDNGEARGYVKYLRDEGGLKSLVSENAEYPVKLLHRGARIIGKVIGAVRYLEGKDLGPAREHDER